MALQTQKIEDLGKMTEELYADDTGKGISILATVDANGTTRMRHWHRVMT